MNQRIGISSKNTNIWVCETSSGINALGKNLFNQRYLGKTASIIVVAIHFLQTAFLFTETTYYGLAANKLDSYSIFSQISKFLLGRGGIDIDSWGPLQIVCLIALAGYLMTLISSLIVSFTKQSKYKRISWLAFRWKTIMQIHFYCFFLPLHNIFSEIAVQVITRHINSLWWIIIIMVVCEAINITACLVHFFTNLSIKVNDPLALMNDAFIKFCWIENIVVSIINLLALFYNVFEMPNIAMNLIYLGLALCHTGHLFYLVPFYCRTILTVFVLEAGFMLSIVITNIVFICSPHIFSQIITASVLVIAVILSLVYLKFATNYIQSHITKTLFTSLNLIMQNENKSLNRYWFIHSIYHLRSILDQTEYTPFAYGHYVGSILKQLGYVQHLNQLFLDKKTGLDNDQQTAVHDIKHLVVKIADLWSRKNPRDNLIRLVLADLMTNDMDMIYAPYFLLQDMSHKGPIKRSFKLSALVMQMKIQEVITDSQSEYSAQMNLDVFYNMYMIWFRLKQSMLTQITNNLKFFQAIQDKSPELFTIMEAGKNAEVLRLGIDAFWKSFPELSNKPCPYLLLTYGVYKIRVNFEYEEGLEIIDKACSIIKKNGHFDSCYDITKETIGAITNNYFIVNTSKKEFGNIVQCRSYCQVAFGESAENLVGQNIGVIMPSFFRRIHDLYILRKLQSSQHMFNPDSFQTFARHKEGFIFPVNILILLFPWVQKGVFFIGIVREIKTQLSYILFNEDGEIDSYSKSLQSRLKLPHWQSEKKVHILELIDTKEQYSQYSSLALYLKNTFLPQKKPQRQTSLFQRVKNNLNVSDVDSKTEDDPKRRRSFYLDKITSNSVHSVIHPQKHSSDQDQSSDIITTETVATLEGIAVFRQMKSIRSKVEDTGEGLKMKWKLDVKRYAGQKLGILALEDTSLSGNGHTFIEQDVSQSSYSDNKLEKIVKDKTSKEDSDEYAFSEQSENRTGFDATIPDFSQVLPKTTAGLQKFISESNNISLDLKKFPSSRSSWIPEPSSARLLINMNNQDSVVTPGPEDVSPYFAGDEAPREFPSGRKKGQTRTKQTSLKSSAFSKQKLVQATQSNLITVEKTEGGLLQRKETVKTNPEVDFEKYFEQKSRISSAKANLDLAKNIPTLKFYKYNEAKIPVTWFAVSLIVLLVSGVSVFLIANNTVPVIETMFTAESSSLERILALAEINWEITSISAYTTTSYYCEACIRSKQQLLYPEIIRFGNANGEIDQNMHLFSPSFQESTFQKNVKVYLDNFNNIDTFGYYSGLGAAKLLINYAMRINNAQNFTDPFFRKALEGLIQNMFNDILVVFQKQSHDMAKEIVELIDNTESESRILFILTIVIFIVTMIFITIVHLKDYIDLAKFLKLLTCFNPDDISAVINQIGNFKKSVESDFQGEDMLEQAKIRPKSSKNSFLYTNRDRTFKVKKLIINCMKRNIAFLVLLIVPIIVTITSMKTFDTNFGNIGPILSATIQPKQIMTQALVCLTEAAVSNVRKDIVVNNMNITDAISECISGLDELVSEQALTSQNANYALFHSDYCDFVNPANYTMCKGLFNGISTSGLTGAILTMQTNLFNYLQVIKVQNVAVSVFAIMFRDCHNMITLANDAADFVQSQNVESLNNDLENIKYAIRNFIIVSLVSCLVLSCIGKFYGYSAVIRERRQTCRILFIFPEEFIAQNQRLKTFLMRNSKEFKDSFNRVKQRF